MSNTNMPALGEMFPEMEVVTTRGSMNLPEDMKGKWWVLFSHPADFTPVCTTEFVAFQKRKSDFDAVNCDLIGMSVDQVFSHIKWIQWIKETLDVTIDFPVIADELGQVSAQLGMIHSSKGTNTVRAVFVIDPEGKMRLILYYPQEIGRNMDEILRAVKALQTSDSNGVAIPAGWPSNEIINDRVIIPPAKDEAAAGKRMEEAKAGKIECFDWWFCHKKLS
jgi:peroxiredoxin (alkyl hydroperoxide reductase subunit C)